MAASGKGGGGGSASGIRAGGAFVELFTKDAKLVAGLRTAQGKVRAFATSTAGLISAGLLSASSAILAPLALAFKGGVARAEVLEDLQDQFGLTAEGASRLAYAFDVAGDGAESLEAVLKGLAKANTTGLPLDQFALQMADSLLAIEDPSRRAATALEVLGRGGLSFLKVAGDLRKLMGEAPIIDQASLDAAEALGNSFNKLSVSIKSAVTPAVKIIAPVVEAIADWIAKNQNLVMVLAGVGAVLGVVGGAIAAVGLAGAAASVIWAGLGTVWTACTAIAGALAAAVGLLMTPFGLVALAVAGAVAALVALFALSPEARGWAADLLGVVLGPLSQAWQFLKETALTTWGGIVDAVKAGDLSLAAEVAMAGVMVVWKAAIAGLTIAWNRFKDYVVDGFHAIRLAAEKTWEYVKGANPLRSKEHQDTNIAELEQAFAANRAARHAARKADEQLAIDDALAAQQVLRDVRARAAAAGAPKAAPKAADIAAQAEQVATMVRGAFMFASAAGAFGGGPAVGILKQSLDAHKKTAANTAGILARMGDGDTFD